MVLLLETVVSVVGLAIVMMVAGMDAAPSNDDDDTGRPLVGALGTLVATTRRGELVSAHGVVHAEPTIRVQGPHSPPLDRLPDVYRTRPVVGSTASSVAHPEDITGGAEVAKFAACSGFAAGFWRGARRQARLLLGLAGMLKDPDFCAMKDEVSSWNVLCVPAGTRGIFHNTAANKMAQFGAPTNTDAGVIRKPTYDIVAAMRNAGHTVIVGQPSLKDLADAHARKHDIHYICQSSYSVGAPCLPFHCSYIRVTPMMGNYTAWIGRLPAGTVILDAPNTDFYFYECCPHALHQWATTPTTAGIDPVLYSLFARGAHQTTTASTGEDLPGVTFIAWNSARDAYCEVSCCVAQLVFTNWNHGILFPANSQLAFGRMVTVAARGYLVPSGNTTTATAGDHQLLRRLVAKLGKKMSWHAVSGHAWKPLMARAILKGLEKGGVEKVYTVDSVCTYLERFHELAVWEQTPDVVASWHI